MASLNKSREAGLVYEVYKGFQRLLVLFLRSCAVKPLFQGVKGFSFINTNKRFLSTLCKCFTFRENVMNIDELFAERTKVVPVFSRCIRILFNLEAFL